MPQTDPSVPLDTLIMPLASALAWLLSPVPRTGKESPDLVCRF